MFNDDDKITGLACEDCVIMTVNNDRSGVSDDWDFSQWFLTNNYNYVVIEDEVHDFSHQRCDICLSTLSGKRQEFSMWEYPED